jgi:methionyl-tRNA formyltransferase
VRAVFFGTPELAVPSLEAVAVRHDLVALVCQPDKPQGRSSRLAPPPTKVWAESHGVAVAQPAALNDGRFESWLREQRPDVCPLVAYGRILKQPILDVPAHGFINVHPSVLPEYRGPSPIQTAILDGKTRTGITIMRLDAGTDSGDIVLQKEIEIRPDDTTRSLSQRLGGMGAQLLAEALDLIEQGRATFTPQDHARATVTRMYGKDDGRIRWELPARRIHNLVRAAIPWPVAHCLFRGEVCRIHKTEPVDEPAAAPPGTVTRVEKDRVAVATGEGQLAVLEIQAPGKKPMPMADYLRGHQVKVGDTFEDIAP